MELKQTLNMPKTDFDMRAKLNTKEPVFIKRWLENNIYEKRLEMNKSNQPFVLHDGPPYANGDIHVGHAMNKILKDFIFRSKSMQGFYTPIIHGWDTHGLPIEHKMLSSKGIDRKTLTTLNLIDMCKEYAISQVERQAEQMERLNLLGPTKNRYLTLFPEFEALQLSVFSKMVEDGLVHRGYKPVYWSPSSESALADAEIEYANHTSPSIYVACEIENGNNVVNAGDELVIWTTTPWTIPANAGIAVGEKIQYSLVKLNDKRNIVIATDLVEKVISDFKGENTFEIISTFSSEELIGITYKHPLFGHSLRVVYGHHVTLDAGTGLVHIAPGFGVDDFMIGKKENLELIMHINDDGTLNENAQIAVGLDWQEANKPIGMKLAEENKLISIRFMKHSYPHDWRTKKPVMYRATLQWFVSIEKIKPALLKSIKEQNWTPEWGQKRMQLMIENRGDWCISRQRKWGVPIPVFYKDGEPVLDQEIFKHIESLVKINGSRIWFEKTADELLPTKWKNKGLVKETDIMDVWFDSGTSHLGALIPNGIINGADLYLEGSDQYRGWFNSSLITGTIMNGKSPYKQAISHGFVLDEKGRKMSKSVGNVIDPLKVCDSIGADILRVWVASSDFKADVNVGQNILKQTSEIYRKWRNTFKFMLGNLNDFNSSNKPSKLESEDLFILQRLYALNNRTISNYNNYDFSNIVKDVTNFIVQELSSFYLDFSKDILYCDAKDSLRRRQIQSVLFECVSILSKIVAPIIPVTAEEINDHLNIPSESIHLENIDVIAFDLDAELEDKWNKFFELKSVVSKSLEVARNEKVIKKTMEATISLNVPPAYSVLKSVDLKSILMVHNLHINWDSNKLSAQTTNVEGSVCERCWNKFNSEDVIDGLCPRCKEVIK